MAHNRWPKIVSIIFLAAALSACASHRDTGNPMASDQGVQSTVSTDFGGQPKDQEARERHHPQYPDSAQHLGPQQDQKGVSNEAAQSREQTEAERAAVSGVGK